MQTVEEIRREKLAVLIREAGSQAALSEKIEKAPAQISQWLNASTNSKTGKPRVMSNAVARAVEAKTGKPIGWMDQPVQQTPTTTTTAIADNQAPPTTLAQALDVLASSLNELTDDRRELAAQRLQTLARAPDSARAMESLLAALRPASAPPPPPESRDFQPPVPPGLFVKHKQPS